ncbi:hypothetical protein SWZG_00246 [Synechococcus phage S-SKS1]|uniref:Uncharacterized protein n=1 Tax=Synechococcus phage S-SKS1 TaxID=754042 RepID=M4R1W3_9CAUD|nr:tail fiber protein [Synechococcus phage S-SKS1]AGH31752.1 hypothetical protein SWZG_00246 [Synechococcus phage S-SKS1]
MPLNKLDSIIKNTEGRILYVSPSDLDSTDSISNQGNSLARPFKTIQRALIESARFSYVKGNNNDETEKTTILLMPGNHVVDNRPGYSINSSGTTSTPDGTAIRDYQLTLDSVFDLTQKDNDLYKFNSVNGGVIVPRGTSIVGLDLRKTKIRPLYVPNPTDDDVLNSAIFRITGACYLWQFSIFDGDEFGTVYTQPDNFELKSTPTFSHHKLTVFEYADGVNDVGTQGVTDLAMYYAKLSKAYSAGSGREVDPLDRFPGNKEGFTSVRPEFEIVGAFASDPIVITSIISGDGATPTRTITVTTQVPHGLDVGTPIRIKDVSDSQYNISTRVTEVSTISDNIFFYTISSDPALISPTATPNEGTVTIETDTVSGASPYIFNISMRSVWGMNGMHTDGSKATGFRSMVVAQFTGISLQKDDRAFVKYIPSSREYRNDFYSSGTTQTGSVLSSKSSSSGIVYHLDSDAIYRKGWEQTHIKMSNDAIVQIVSVFAIGYNKHFEAQSGGDASVTNSNSNFGQLSLISEGFKKEAFEKDNKAFITHIIPPRALHSIEEDIDWLTLDQDATNTSTKLYLFGFDNEDVKPPILTQGYRVGAKVNDKLFLTVGGTEYSADILMSDGSSSFKEYPVTSGPSSNIFTTGTHGIVTGEKVIIISDDGDLPENLRTNTVYYAIAPNNTTVKLAASEAEALADEPITVYGGTNLKILTRVSDKQSGDAGHPVQWDGSQWYINVTNAGTMASAINSLSGATEPTIIKRTPDNRSLDEKIYKVRVVVPSQLSNAKTPEAGFVLQESSTTGYVGTADTNRTTIDSTNYDYNRNPRFISTCSFSNPTDTVTVITELPHSLKVGDSVTIKNVTDSTNTTGLIDKGYNGTYNVDSVSATNDLEFTYTTTSTPGTFTNNVNERTTSLPRFERTDLQSNLYVYRNEIISEYSDGDSNGVYHLYTLNSNNAIQNEFTNLEYSQNVTDLYPQLDRDNPNDDPNSATTYALRSPIGEVQTDDLKKSITRESANLLLTSLGIGLDIASVTNPTSTTPTITFDRNHNFNSIVTGTLGATSGFTPGTYFNVKIYNNIGLTQWNGATAKVSVAGTTINSVEIMNGGSNYSDGTYFLDTGVIGAGTPNTFTVTSADISSHIGDVVQFTGVGIGTDTYHRIDSVTGRNSISIARTTGDPVITSDNYAFITAPSVAFTASGDVVTAPGHGLVVGNKFRVIGINTSNFGDYIVESSTLNEFEVTGGIGTASGFILKHGLSSNSGVSDRSNENLQSRAITVFDGETLTLSESGGIDATSTAFSVSSPGIAGTMTRFPLGSYIQIDNEIMRIASDSLSGTPTDEITVIRGALATSPVTHVENSTIRKIKVPSIEFHRPSIIRASGHTFEYLGYGPGNYSTGLPQVQDRTITEREEFLSQAQERSSGLVVYTGMNNKGDFYIGNQKKSSATGEETNFDIPVPTVTGEDPSRLSAVFDEVTIKERLVVEGGDSGQVLSQFGGPVTFDKDVRIKEELKVTGDTKLKNLSSTTNILPINDNVDVDGSITADQFIATTPSFTNINGNDIYHMLRSNGTQGLITSGEVTNALGFTPASIGSITGDFPLGNSIVVDDISSQFNGTLTDFALLRASAAFIPAGSSANLIVSLGGVIQKPGSDYFIVQSGGENTNTIRFTTAPLSGTSAFIIGLGGQGSLISNLDWDTKGEIIVATGNNSAAKVQVGQNGYALTADSNQTTGVSWQPSVPRGSVFYVATATTPAGYLYCDGTRIPTSGTFQGIAASLLQDLRTLLGTSYGATGTLPNLVNRFAGYSATPGNTGGSANATLVSHSHTVTGSTNQRGGIARWRPATPSPSVTHGGGDVILFDEGNVGDGEETDFNNGVQLRLDTRHTHTVSGTAGNQGSSATNKNLPPYLGMRPIIKY